MKPVCEFSLTVASGDCVVPPGEDFRRGDELMAAGDVLNPGKLALLAFAGKPSVRVYRRPHVAIVCTGNELVDVEDIPARGQVRNSNAVAISALVRAAGGSLAMKASLQTIIQTFRRCSKERGSGTDLIITTGEHQKENATS